MVVIDTTMITGTTPFGTSITHRQFMIRCTSLRQRNGQLPVSVSNQLKGYGDVELHTSNVALILHHDRQAKRLARRILHGIYAQHVSLTFGLSVALQCLCQTANSQ